MQIPATLRMNVQPWCREDSRMDGLDGERLRTVLPLTWRCCWKGGPASRLRGMTLSCVPLLCQHRGNPAWKTDLG